MARRQRAPATPAERVRREQAQADKLTALHEQLSEQVQALRTGQDWTRWLDVARRFHSYSFNNTLLIAAQRPEATAVAGFAAWQALGRQVNKGERGLQILAPVVRRTSSAGQGEAGEPQPQPPGLQNGNADPAGAAEPPDRGKGRGGQVAGFRVAYVWDVSQTAGEPLAEQPRPQLLAGQAPEGLWEGLAGLLTARGFTLERGDCGAANGYTDFAARTVRVRVDVDDAQAVKTLAHEAGHVLLHEPTGSTANGAGVGEGTTAGCRGVKEVEAESVAYLVASSHGLDTGGYTFPYVTGWAAGADSPGGASPETVVRLTGQRVLTATRTVLAATQPDTAGAVEPALAARVQAGAERTAIARRDSESTARLTSLSWPTGAAGRAAEPELEVLVGLHEDARAFYTAQLSCGRPDAGQVLALLGQRAIPGEAVTGFELGYAPPGWSALVEHLRTAGYTDTQLLDAGVALATRRGTVVDRFRDRVMFPVRDPSGRRVVAFIGRALHEGPGVPKYLNSPQTALYRKSEVLYGLGAPPVRAALAAGARPVLVEGALDAIAVTAAGAGAYAGVAPSGTALTAGQVTALGSAAPPAGRGVVVAFDADPAGQAAALRAYPLLRAADIWPAAAALPGGQDPAGLAQQHGAAALRAVLDAATPLAELVVDEQLTRWAGRLTTVEGQVGAARDAARLIAAMPAEQIGGQVLRVAGRLGLDPGHVTRAVTEAMSADDGVRRLERPEHYGALDVSPGAGEAASAVQLARAGYPAPVRGCSPAAQHLPVSRSTTPSPVLVQHPVRRSR